MLYLSLVIISSILYNPDKTKSYGSARNIFSISTAALEVD